MKAAMKKHTMAPKFQKAPSTPHSRAEMKTGRPAKGRKMEMPAAAQPVPQNVKRKVGVKK